MEPSSQLGWATLAQTLGVQVMHIAERDTQVTHRPKRRDEFVNTCVCCSRCHRAVRCCCCGYKWYPRAHTMLAINIIAPAWLVSLTLMQVVY